MTTTDPDVFGVDAQASFVKHLGIDLAQGAKKFGMESDSTALNPLLSADTIAKALGDTGVDQEYIDAVLAIKDDPDVQEAVDIFQRSLEGTANINETMKKVPQAENGTSKGFIAFVNDPGLNGAVVKGSIPPGEDSNVVSMSNYLSGAGTSFGGLMADLPQTVSDMTNDIHNASLFRYFQLEDKLKKHSGELSKVIQEHENYVKTHLFDPEDAYRKRKPYYIDLSGVRNDPALAKVEVRSESRKTKLLRETFLAKVEVERAQIKYEGKLKAQKILGHVGAGVQGATGAFSAALGGLDSKAGDEMIQNAERRFRNNKISEEEYADQMRDGRLRLAQGVLGVGDGISSIGEIVVEKVTDKLKDTSKAALMTSRFASAVGGVVSIAMGATSIAKNAIAAQEASETGNIGKAAMYGIMAALDCVSLVLDCVSVVCDFVPLIV